MDHSSRSFSSQEKAQIAALITRLTGSSVLTNTKVEACSLHVARSMEKLRIATLAEYLVRVEADPREMTEFISSATIHTTSWFRETPHFDRLFLHAKKYLENKDNKEVFSVLSAGSSSGEEAYSMGLVLEGIRQKFLHFDYRIDGWDVDLKSTQRASRALYLRAALDEIPPEYRKHVLIGTNKTEGLMTIDAEIRSRCHFNQRNLLSTTSPVKYRYDAIFCRNVLIYFDPDKISQIVTHLVDHLKPTGMLCLGHSETIQPHQFQLKALGHTTYVMSKPMPTQKVTVSNGMKAAPQVMKRPDIILIGASTGGTETLVSFLHDLPKPCPPVVVVQHIAQSFAVSFAKRLAHASGLELGDAMQHLGPLKANHLYFMTDDLHIGVKPRGGFYYPEISRDPLIHGVRPSVDFLFHSAARQRDASRVAAVLLTGMGKDGASGMRALKLKNAMTFAQDEASSIVFGMPREAIALGAAGFVGNPAEIRHLLSLMIQDKKAA